MGNFTSMRLYIKKLLPEEGSNFFWTLLFCARSVQFGEFRRVL